MRARQRRPWEVTGEDFWTWYDRYLLSDAWRVRRAEVLKRASGVCEGCRKRVAKQVHHLTYERVGHEMLFDLVAVCSQCHSELHAKGGAP